MIKEKGEEFFLNTEIAPNDKALRELGVQPSAFAWPNGYYDTATDKAIAKWYRHAHAAKRYFPKDKSFAEEDSYFIPLSKTSDMISFPAHGIDEIHGNELEQHIFPAMKRAKDNGTLLTLYAHTISPSGQGLSVTPDTLEKIFQKAHELNLEFYRFDDIP